MKSPQDYLILVSQMVMLIKNLFLILLLLIIILVQNKLNNNNNNKLYKAIKNNNNKIKVNLPHHLNTLLNKKIMKKKLLKILLLYSHQELLNMIIKNPLLKEQLNLILIKAQLAKI